jgi:hypothetical protein
MSLPAVKWSPAEVNMTARIAKSFAASLSPLANPEYIDRVRAFIFSGRFNVRVSTLFSRLLTISLMAPILRGDLGKKERQNKNTRRGGFTMARDITISSRELTPFEQLVLELVCEGKSNAAINLLSANSYTFRIIKALFRVNITCADFYITLKRERKNEETYI